MKNNKESTQSLGITLDCHSLTIRNKKGEIVFSTLSSAKETDDSKLALRILNEAIADLIRGG